VRQCVPAVCQHLLRRRLLWSERGYRKLRSLRQCVPAGQLLPEWSLHRCGGEVSGTRLPQLLPRWFASVPFHYLRSVLLVFLNSAARAAKKSDEAPLGA
jgi:hypothetical protein